MAKQTISLGTAPEGAGGDTARTAFEKAQANFDELYAQGYRRENILGTVAQSSGIPTAAIIEQGSNANGRYVRYADGTQITWHSITQSLDAGQTQPFAFSTPAGFTGAVNSVVGVNCSENTLNVSFGMEGFNGGGGVVYVFNGNGSAVTVTVHLRSMGRWY